MPIISLSYEMSDTNGKIEVSKDLARELIPILEAQITQIENAIVSYEDDRDNKARTLAELKAKLNGSDATSKPDGGTRKKLPKGQGERIVTELLKSSPPTARWSIQQIVEKTGIAYSSVFRLLKKKNTGQFSEHEGLWKYSGK